MAGLSRKNDGYNWIRDKYDKYNRLHSKEHILKQVYGNYKNMKAERLVIDFTPRAVAPKPQITEIILDRNHGVTTGYCFYETHKRHIVSQIRMGFVVYSGEVYIQFPDGFIVTYRLNDYAAKFGISKYSRFKIRLTEEINRQYFEQTTLVKIVEKLRVLTSIQITVNQLLYKLKPQLTW